MRTTFTGGCKNSQTTSRPPGFSTRWNSLSAARGCCTLRSPNEMVTLEDLDRTARLLAAFARRLTPDTDFVPR